MDVSIIIVTYNTCRMTSECIDSIIDKTKGIEYEIILVDNDSKDGSYDLFSKDNRITYIHNSENLGFGKANNIGIDASRGRNILFLNSDTLLINNAIKFLSEYLDSNRDVGAVGGNLYDSSEKPGMSYHLLRPSLKWELNRLLFNIPSWIKYGKTGSYFNTTSKPIDVGYIMGADLMVRKSIIKKTGGFDLDFFMYFEETELCNRIANAGYHLRVIPEAKIIHLEGKSFSGTAVSAINPQKIKLFENSRAIYYSKNFSRPMRKLISIIYAISIPLHLIAFRLSGNKEMYETLKIKREILRDSSF